MWKRIWWHIKMGTKIKFLSDHHDHIFLARRRCLFWSLFFYLRTIFFCTKFTYKYLRFTLLLVIHMLIYSYIIKSITQRIYSSSLESLVLFIFIFISNWLVFHLTGRTYFFLSHWICMLNMLAHIDGKCQKNESIEFFSSLVNDIIASIGEIKIYLDL